MNRRYWERLSQAYEDEIFSVPMEDRKGVVFRAIRRHLRGLKTVADFGCGNGRFLPLLATGSQRVEGFDLSRGLLAEARRRCANLAHVHVAARDLRRRLPRSQRFDGALTVNVLIGPGAEDRRKLLATMAAALRPGASLVAVVPSLESSWLTQMRWMEWHRRDGLPADQAARQRVPALRAGGLARLPEGVVRIEGVPTKHYLKEEFALLWPEAGLTLASIRKVEYEWTTEFAPPPRWMKAPYPWDWLVVAQRG